MPASLTVQERGDKAPLNTPGAEDLVAKFGGKGVGLPVFAFLDAKGDAIITSLRPAAGNAKPENIGYPVQPEEVDWFMTMVKKAAPAMSPDEADILEKWLRSQKK